MSEAIIVALITAGVSLFGTIIAIRAGNDKLTHEIHEHNAVQDEQIKELTREVRIHNGFAERVPALEIKVEALEKKVERMEEKQ